MQGDKRLTTHGKHLLRGEDPHRVHGVTYGSFRRRADGAAFPEHSVLRADFDAMRRYGVDTIRTYELPPDDVLELAAERGMMLLCGLHYHDWRLESASGRAARRRIEDAGRRAVDEALERLAGRPEVMGVTVGNEVPVDLVRLHGRAHVERTLVGMIDRLHAGDAGLLATYVNYPTTEFLEIPNQDLFAFNVFLEDRAAFERYLEHLQILSGARPLLITELGLAAEPHSARRQADVLRDQLRCVDEQGVAGAFVFSWTDDWVVADEPVTGWGFGITDEHRAPKPAVQVVSEWCTTTYPKSLRETWPRVSVIVCAYNEEATIAECLDSVLASTYPDLELILCDDGSTDATAAIARDRGVRMLSLDHAGLSHARNAGLAAATGEIVAYLDADAACHPDWPYHLALSMESDVAATGGPNLPVPHVGLVERAISHVPGQASEVLLGPGRAEHVPGCNMAFAREHLVAIGGFDERYVAAGDDVDVCWKLIDAGHEIGFSASAQVLHHRRGTVRGFLRQQRGYGRAERMLSGPHRHRLNVLGQARWRGFVYGPGALLPRLLRPTVYTGWIGSAPFQPAISHRAHQLGNLVAATLPIVAGVGLVAAGASVVFPAAALVVALALLWFVGIGVGAAVSVPLDHREPARRRLRALVGLLTVLQPLARTWGRLRGTTLHAEVPPVPLWSGDRMAWIAALHRELHSLGRRVTPGGVGSFWDLEVTDRGPVSARITTAVAWAWEPRTSVRYHVRPTWFPALVGAGVVGVLGGTQTWIVLALAATVVAVSLHRTRRSVNAAVDRTTRAAHETVARATGTGRR